MPRSARQVLNDHLRDREQGLLNCDLNRDYADDVVALTDWGVFRGREGIEDLAHKLQKDLPKARYDYCTVLVEGSMAFLRWKAENGVSAITDGADSFLIENGRIVAQTIHYTVSRTGPDQKPSSQRDHIEQNTEHRHGRDPD